MTTTITSATPAIATSATKRSSNTANAASRRRTVQLSLAVAVVGLLAAAVWAATSWKRSASQLANIDRFTVVPRTFTVALKEKGELKAAKSTDVKCEVEGKSTIITLIDEGTAVKEGDLLVELASDEIENKIRQEELKESNAITSFEAAKAELDIQRDQNASNIRKAELQIELKKLELDKYEKGDWEQKIKDAQIAIEQATISLQRREQDYKAYKELFDKKYTTQTEFQEKEFDFKKAQWELEKANKAREVLQMYTHVADSRQKTSDLEEAIKECERVKKNAENEEVKKVRTLEGKEKELALTQDQLAKFRSQRSHLGETPAPRGRRPKTTTKMEQRRRHTRRPPGPNRGRPARPRTGHQRRTARRHWRGAGPRGRSPRGRLGRSRPLRGTRPGDCGSIGKFRPQ